MKNHVWIECRCGTKIHVPKLIGDWSTDALIAEIARRSNKPKGNYRIPRCDDCEHFKAFTGDGEPSEDFNPCELGHAMSFRLPRNGDPHDDAAGFYKRGCKDRK